MKIMAFGFRRETGKETLCNMIQRELRLKNKGHTVHVVGFEDQIKGISAAFYGWAGIKSARYYEEHPELEDTPIIGLPNGWKTPRDVHITVGNHMRQLDRFIWMNALLKTITCDVLLIKDLRFPQEIDAVHAHNGKIVLVNRSISKGSDGEVDIVLMDRTDWDYIVENESNLHHLNNLAIEIAGDLV